MALITDVGTWKLDRYRDALIDERMTYGHDDGSMGPAPSSMDVEGLLEDRQEGTWSQDCLHVEYRWYVDLHFDKGVCHFVISSSVLAFDRYVDFYLDEDLLAIGRTLMSASTKDAMIAVGRDLVSACGNQQAMCDLVGPRL